MTIKSELVQLEQSQLQEMTEQSAKMAHQLAILGNRLDQLKGIAETQCQEGNYDTNSYMFGLANGLLLAQAIMFGEDPKFLEAPDEWLDSKRSEDGSAGSDRGGLDGSGAVKG